jgi:hypothetical protein
MDKMINESSALIPFDNSNDTTGAKKTSTISSISEFKNEIKKKVAIPTMDQSFQKVI